MNRQASIMCTNPPNEPWSEDGLESVAICPVCDSTSRDLLYEGLIDRVFSAPGTWNLYRCVNCRCGFLNPRPTPETIERAYLGYFTHAVDGESADRKLPIKRWLQRAMANGYRNHKFGTHFNPSSRLGVIAAYLQPSKRAVLDAELRHIAPAFHGERLLDVGCGNGAFLDLARRIGWQTVGVDFDSKAVEAARKLGLDIRLGGINDLDPTKELFEGITLSHVIEHVDEPRELLHSCFRLLKPGGWIWIETPNLNAVGHQLYGRNWRGLEPPRHLVLFTRQALLQVIKEVGFNAAKDQPYRPLCYPMFSASEYIANMRDQSTSPRKFIEMVRQGEAVALHDYDQREFITLKAWKPVPVARNPAR